MQKGSLKEARFETTTSPQICCRTTLRKVGVQLYSFTFFLTLTSFTNCCAILFAA